jgi:hypothetical protein
MTNEPQDAGATLPEQPRRTNQGRNFGNISYAAEEPEQTDDLRPRISVSVPHVPDEHWSTRPSRSTGARRSVN